MSKQCIGEPISWLKLEQYVLGELGPEVARKVEAHTNACDACRECLAEVKAGMYQPLPPLNLRNTESWWQRLGTRLNARALAFGAALVMLVAIVPRLAFEPVQPSTVDPRFGVKGEGVVALLIRERNGIVEESPTTYRPGDRFKWMVTCAPPQIVRLDVAVLQDGELSFPLDATSVECRNRKSVPGAFSLTGSSPATVCLLTEERDRNEVNEAILNDNESGASCVTVEPASP